MPLRNKEWVLIIIYHNRGGNNTGLIIRKEQILAYQKINGKKLV